MSFKDLTAKSELFFKLALKRSAQTAGDPWSGMKPEDVSSMPVEQLQEKLFPRTTPATTSSTTQPAAPAAAKPAPAAAKPAAPSGLPAGGAALLAPYKGKGLLQVTQNGKNVSIIYNARGMSDTGLQKKLQDAMPGFTVTVHGQTQFTPQMANY